MKKYFLIVFALILVFTGLASADAPYAVEISLEDTESTYDTTLILTDGDQIAVNFGVESAIITIENLSEDGLNFAIDIPLNSWTDGEPYMIGAFLLPEGRDITLTHPDADKPVLTLSWTRLVLDPLFQEVLDKVSAELGGDADAAKDDEISYIYTMANNYGTAENFGFYVTDLDENGSPELLIGEKAAEESPVFYDMFALNEGELVHVFSGGERSRYYLAENGGIIHESSSSAFQSSTAFLYFDDSELHLMEAVIYDSQARPEDGVYFLSTTSEYEVEDSAQAIDDAYALYMQNLYGKQNVTLEAFGE